MNSDPYVDRRRLTFEQAEGVDPLPAQLKTKQLSQKLRSRLWKVVYEEIRQHCVYNELQRIYYLAEPWRDIFYSFHTIHLDLMADDFVNDPNKIISTTKVQFANGPYTRVLGFLQFVLRHPACPPGFDSKVQWALTDGQAAYRVLDRGTIVPVGSDAELITLQRAFADLGKTEIHGARSHLRAAGDHLTAGDYPASVRESIHSVESVARSLAPSGALKEALAELQNSSRIHPSLQSGFSKIYGYTSDEQGVRHPLLDAPEADVDEADALFMIGACAAFVSYLIHKARLAGLLKDRS